MGDMQLPTTSPDHAGHDPLLIAGLADRAADALTADEQRVAEALVASCVECASLHADLVALTAATTTSAIPTRPRDYRLTEADAHRLRPRGWRRWLADIGSPRDAFSRPLAVGLTTLGLAGLLVATVPTVLPGVGGTGSGTASDPAAGPVGEAPVTGFRIESADEGSPDPGPGPLRAGAASDTQAERSPQDGTSDGVAGGVAEGGERAATPADVGRTTMAVTGSELPLVVVSTVSLVAGGSLFVLRRRAPGNRPRIDVV